METLGKPKLQPEPGNPERRLRGLSSAAWGVNVRALIIRIGFLGFLIMTLV